MKPGERIRLIKESARLLGQQSWSDIRLTLLQHQMRIYDMEDWDDPVAYVSYCIENAADDVLAQFHEYLEGENAGPVVRDVSGHPWGGNPVRIFLSHIHQERHLVGDVKRRLEGSYGIDAFVAHDDPSVQNMARADQDSARELSLFRRFPSRWVPRQPMVRPRGGMGSRAGSPNSPG
jgi:hypothetical protein